MVPFAGILINRALLGACRPSGYETQLSTIRQLSAQGWLSIRGQTRDIVAAPTVHQQPHRSSSWAIGRRRELSVSDPVNQPTTTEPGCAQFGSQ
jgi:hypothetical protein